LKVNKGILKWESGKEGLKVGRGGKEEEVDVNTWD